MGGALGALAGGLAGGRHHALEGVLIGGAAGAIAGGLVGHMIDQDQQRRLQEQSPQPLQTIQHNDAVYQQQQQVAQPQTSGQAPQPQTSSPPAEALTPLTVDDIKRLTRPVSKRTSSLLRFKDRSLFIPKPTLPRCSNPIPTLIQPSSSA